MAAITATQIADELNISRSYLYLLRKNGVFTLENNKWDTSVIDTVSNYMESLAPKKVKENKIITEKAQHICYISIKSMT